MGSGENEKNPFAQTETAHEYDTWYETPLGATLDRLQKQLVFEMARPRAGERALDVGTGTGNYACALAEQGLEVTGLDPSGPMLAVARGKSCAVEWQQGVAERLPFSEEAFDLVVSVTTLEFVSEPAAALSEMYRVTAPRGRLVVGTLNADSHWGRMYEEQAESGDSPFASANLFEPKEFVNRLGRLGHVQWGSAGFVPPSGTCLGWADLFEWIGRRLFRTKGSLLVGRVDK